MTLYCISYKPIISTPAGRAAVTAKKILPFVDGSIRREPDLELEAPTISSLCRSPHKEPNSRRAFVNRLKPGDIVICWTVTGIKHGGITGRFLTAILRVERVHPDHPTYAAQARIGRLAYNCIVPTNPHLPYGQTAGASWCNSTCMKLFPTFVAPGGGYFAWPINACLCLPVGLCCAWDNLYDLRAIANPKIAECKPLYKNLCAPPQLSDATLHKVFGKVPGTQNPGSITSTVPNDLVRALCRELRISLTEAL